MDGTEKEEGGKGGEEAGQLGRQKSRERGGWKAGDLTTYLASHSGPSSLCRKWQLPHSKLRDAELTSRPWQLRLLLISSTQRVLARAFQT